MQRALHTWRARVEPTLNRLDRIAELTNPPLFIVVVVLALIDVSCFTALRIVQQHPREITAPATQ